MDAKGKKEIRIFRGLLLGKFGARHVGMGRLGGKKTAFDAVEFFKKYKLS